MKSIKISKQFIKELIVVILLLISILSVAWAKKHNETKIYEEKNNQQTKDTANTKTNESSFHQKLTLTIDDKEFTLLEGDRYLPKFYIWNGYVYINKYKENKPYIVRVNLENGDEEILVDTNQYDYPIVSKYVDNFYRINNDLLITTTEYMIPGSVFRVDGETNEFSLLEKLTGSKIKNINQNYYLIQSDGDSCGGYRSYRYLDIENYTATYIADFGIGCTMQPTDIGFFGNKIIYVTKEKQGPDVLQFTYSELRSVTSTPPIVDTLLATLPADTTSVIKFSDDEILVIADDIWTYNTRTNTLLYKMEFPDVFNNAYVRLNESKDGLILQNQDLEYIFMFSDGSYVQKNKPLEVYKQEVQTKEKVINEFYETMKEFSFNSNIKYYVNGERVPLYIF